MRTIHFFSVGVIFFLAGCKGVQLNPEYTALLDQTTALSAEDASRAQAGQMTQAQETQALVGQAGVWKKFQAAARGQASTPTTQPQ